MCELGKICLLQAIMRSRAHHCLTLTFNWRRIALANQRQTAAIELRELISKKLFVRLMSVL